MGFIVPLAIVLAAFLIANAVDKLRHELTRLRILHESIATEQGLKLKDYPDDILRVG